MEPHRVPDELCFLMTPSCVTVHGSEDALLLKVTDGFILPLLVSLSSVSKSTVDFNHRPAP